MDIEFYVGNCTNPGVNAKNSKKITKQKKKIKALEEYIEKLENKPKKDDLSKEEFIDDISLLESIKKIISDLKDQLKKDLKILASLEKEYKKKKGKEITYVFEKIG